MKAFELRYKEEEAQMMVAQMALVMVSMRAD